MNTIVIVGAGHVGGRVALGLRAADWSGRIVLIGDEHDPPYERPPLSKAVLLGEAFVGTLAPAQQYADAHVEWLAGQRVTAIDREVREIALHDGRRIGYQRLLLATGGRARTLPLPGIDLDGVFTLRTLVDARRIAPRLVKGQRVAVIGGGFIGLEVAASARTLGCEVHVLEAAPRLLGRAVPAGVAQRVQALHEARGVQVHVGVAPDRIERSAGALRLVLADGAAIEADSIVVGVGLAPATELAAEAGLACANGIVVDEGLRTSDPLILAAGDVAAVSSPLTQRPIRLESWHCAEDHARVAIANLAGGDATVGTKPWFWSDQYDHTLQIVGDPSLGAATVTRVVGEGARLDFHLAADGGLAGVVGFGPSGALAKEFKLARVLFERGARPSADALGDPAVKLKSLL